MQLTRFCCNKVKSLRRESCSLLYFTKHLAGPPRGGVGGTMAPGPMDFKGAHQGDHEVKGPIRGPLGFIGPIDRNGGPKTFFL